MAALPALAQTMTLDEQRPPPPAFQGSGRNQGIERDRLLKPEDVPHDLMCSICLGVVADQSSETPCGHLFCTECIRSSLRRNPQCPLDKKPLQVGQLRSIREHNLPIRRIWGGIKVKCRFSEHGECPWTGALCDASAHEARCNARHGNPKDLRIRELENVLRKNEASLNEARQREQHTTKRIQQFEEEQRRREHDFDFELQRRDAEARQKISEVEQQAQSEANRANKAEQRALQAEADAGRSREAIQQMQKEHSEVVQDRERRLESAARHAGDAERRAEAAAVEIRKVRDEGNKRSRELESAAENNARAAAANEQRARAAEYELERVARHRQEFEASYRAQAEDLQRERNAATMERDRAVRDQRQQEQAAYAARGQLADVEERLGAAESSRRDLGLRLDACQRELYQAREAAKQAEDQLQRAERHFHEQLAGARARNVTPPNGARTDSEFDGRYNYDRYNVVRLSQLITRSLENRPTEVSPNRIFTCVASCYDDFKRGWTDNPQNYAIDVRMLLTVASASTWFNDQQNRLIDGWLREQGWLGHNHRLAQQPPSQLPPAQFGGAAYPPPLVR